MTEQLQALCERFILNRDILKDQFRWENQLILPVCASSFCEKDMTADPARLKLAKELLEARTGFFSNFRSNVKLPMISMMAMDDDPSARLENTLAIYDILKKYFSGNSYTALIAAIISGMTTVSDADRLAARGKKLYGMMKDAHPFLTGGEDSVFAVLMAFSEKEDQQLFDDMEECYSLARKLASDKNSAQTLSHVLALYDGTPKDKCAKVTALYNALVSKRRKYSKYYELNVLGTLAMVVPDTAAVVQDMIEIDDFLDGKPGYGALGIDKRTRLMHAAMLVSTIHKPNITTSTALTGTLAMIAAQQAAMCAIIASTSAASASAAST